MFGGTQWEISVEAAEEISATEMIEAEASI